MRHDIMKLTDFLKIQVESIPGPDGDPVLRYKLPYELINRINLLIDNQKELEKNINLILKSRIGRSIINLEKAEDKEI